MKNIFTYILCCILSVLCNGVQAQIITTFAGTGTAGWSGDGSAATAAEIYGPNTVMVDPSGNVFISDANNNRVRMINTSGEIIEIAGNGTSGFYGDGGPATAAEFDDPSGLAMDASGNLYVGDLYNQVVRKISPAINGTITTIAGDPGVTGYSGDGGLATAAKFHNPYGLSFDSYGNLYIVDQYNHAIRMIAAGTSIISTFAGTGSLGFSGDGGAATAAHLYYPNCVYVDVYNNVFISDNGNQRIRKVNTSGIISTVAGNGSIGWTGDGSPATSAELAWPAGMKTDELGNFYICVAGDNRIRKVNSAGIISTICGNGTGAFSGDGGPATAAEIDEPLDIAIDRYDNILIADYLNNRIRIIKSPLGVPTFVNGHRQTLTMCENAPPDSINSLLAVSDTDHGLTETWSLRYGPSHGTAVVSYSVTSTGGTLTPVGLYYVPNTNYSGADSFQVWVNNGYALDSTTIVVNVQSLFAGAITPEPAIVCPGSTVTFSDDTSGGTWSSENPGIASVSGSGVVTGASVGNTMISYTITNSCGTTSSLAELTVGNPVISTIVGNGSTTLSEDVAATSTGIGYPSHTAMDASGNLYFGDYTNNRIRKVNTSGIAMTVAGNGSSTYSGSGVAATSTGINHTAGLAVDAAGNIYFADYNNSAVRKVNTSGIISTVAGTGSLGFSGDGGAATAAEVQNPWGVAVDNSGNVFFCDRYNQRIRKVNSSGYISTIAGNGSTGYSGDDGPATAANIGQPVDLAIDRFGNLYFTTWSNTYVREIDVNGIIHTIAGNGSNGYSGDGGMATSAELSSPVGIFADTAGNIYIGDYGNNRVREVNTSGVIQTIAGTGTAGFSGDGGPATAALIYTPYGVAVYGPGNIYVCDAYNGRIREIKAANPYIASITGPASVCPGSAITLTDTTTDGTWSSSATGVATVGSGGVVTGVAPGTVIITYSALLSCGALTAVKTVTVNPLPGPISGIPSTCPASTATLSDASTGGSWSSGNTSVATIGSSSGALTGISIGTSLITYTLPTGCNAITTATITTLYVGPITPEPAIVCPGSTVTLSDGVAGGTWSSADPGIATISGGGVVTGVSTGHALISYTITNSCGTTSALAEVTVGSPVITTIAGTGSLGASGDGGPATAAEFEGIWGVAADASGNVYVADLSDGKVRKINASGIISTFAGNATFGYGGDGGPATSAELYYPTGLAVDGSGNVYIADNYNYRIRKVNTSGYISTVAGNGSGGYTGDGGPATAAKISHANGVAVDAAGNLYIGDTYNYCVRKVSTAGVITTIAGTGASGESGDGGPATAAEIGYINNIGVDNWGNVYISDYYNYRVRVVNSAGIISTFAGNGTAGFSGDGGPATAAHTEGVGSIVADSAGNVFITDIDNERVRIINTSGVITTYAGTGSSGFSGDGGPPTAATFYRPGVLALDNNGNLYINDLDNNRVRKISVSSQAIRPVSGPSSVCAGSAILLVDSSAGGTWSSSSTSTATVGTSGAVLGIAVGTAIITYSVHFPCGSAIATKTITVNPPPGAISGTLISCPGSTTILSDASAGGTWSSGSSGIATIGSSSGVVTGVSIGTTLITYTIPTGCKITATVTISPLYAGVITPEPAYVCPGSTVTLSVDTSGGTWSSAEPGIATITSSGVVTGVSNGNALISYTISGSCSTPGLAIVTVGEPIITTIAGNGSDDETGDGVPATAAAVSHPAKVCIDTSGNIYFTSGGYSVSALRKINTSGIISTFAGTGTAGYSGDGGLAIDAELGYPWGICIDGAGNLYMADFENNRIRKVNSSGIINTIAGTGTAGYSGDGGPATSAKLNGPFGVIVDAAGNIFFTDELNNAVRVINTSGIIKTIAGTGVSGFSGDGGPATSAEFSDPNGIAEDGAGNLYIADYGNYRIRKVSPATGWTISTFAGNGINTYSGDGGAATSAGVGYPSDVFVDVAGNVFISESYKVIREVNTSGVITTIAGNGTSGFSGDGGAASYAKMDESGISGDPSGNIFVADFGNERVRKIYPSNLSVTPVFGLSAMCIGTITPLSDSTPGGTWSSSSSSIATVGTGGIVTGVTAGTAIISYTVLFDCTSPVATKTITVNPLPGAISGTRVICQGSVTTLTDTSSGGRWTSSGIVATVGSTTGVVTGVSGGTSIITYLLGTGCLRDTMVTVNDTPAAVSGPSRVCLGSGITLADGVTGGTWSSSNSSIAYIGSGTGAITGLSLGSAIITYSIGSICNTTTTVTVNSWPSAITGTPVICAGATVTLSDGTAGGSWSSGNTSVATAGSSTGLITGISAGTAIISYLLPTGCYSVITATVNPLPSAIVGFPFLCTGATTLLSDGTSGGTWSSGNATVATVGTSTGLVTGISAGATMITYKLGTGCLASITATVNPLPAAITGTLSVCEGGRTTTLADATTGGTWSSNDYTIGEIGSLSGIVTGVLAGTTTISYTVSATGCMALASVTVNPIPALVTGITTICLSATTTLSDLDPGGSWSSSNATTASVGSTTGIVTGLMLGSATITYTLPTGCYNLVEVVIYPNPSSITGLTTICQGTTTIMSDATPGGTWASSNASVAPVIGSTGMVTGLSAGTAIITYSVSTGCKATTIVTITPVPTAITGPASICAGTTATLTDGVSGGSWSSSTTAMATIGSSTGLLTGVSAGTTIITYSMGSSCRVTRVETVLAAPAAIIGATTLCAGAITTLYNTVTGGVWNSGTATIATIGSGTGIVTGVATGTSIITYSLSTGCAVTTTVNVTNAPTPITGASTVCAGAAITLSDGVTGGIWSSSSGAVATIGTTGIVTGASAGTAIISYSLGTGCLVTKTITAYPSPAPITGTTIVCAGATTFLYDATTGGTWSSSIAAIATIGTGTGIVTGVANGTTIITYSLSTGCAVTTTVNVTNAPTPITGASNVCAGISITLTDGVTGGSWSTSSGAVATIGTTGIVTGASAGTAIISYSVGTGCLVTKTITVYPSPALITGSTTVCAGAITNLYDATTGGTWSSGTTSVAAIGAGTGMVSGVSAGSSVITYSLSTGCAVTTTVNVTGAPTPITGVSMVCQGDMTTLTDGTGGGSWSSSLGAVATIGTTGIVTGASAGTAIISYSLGTGCLVTKTFTVLLSPAPISGATTVCAGATTTLHDITTGGVWSSDATAVATISTGTGIVTGVATGSSIITYSLSTGCAVTTTVTVTGAPTSIGGASNVCAGTTITLTDGVTGSGWGSSTGAVATIGTTGIVTGVSAGTAIISYSLGTGCLVTKTITVFPSPITITGATTVCAGAMTNLYDATTGGTWNSGVTAIATIGAGTGMVTGVSAGTSIITYSLSTGCSVTTTVNVSNAPTPIIGASTLCPGAAITLTDGTGGGSWSSSTGAVATIGTTGIVTGASAGTAIISYSLGTGCLVTKTITVFASPAPITGATTVCAGAMTNLYDATTGGTWNSGVTAIATIGAGTGMVTGVSAGTSIITYSLSTGCSVTTTVNVSNAPTPITGASTVCPGATITLTDGTGGGSWSSSTGAVATIGTSSGIVAGVSAGTTIISYSLGTGCLVTKTITVFPSPAPITGATTVCEGAITNLYDATTGGAWSISATSVATIGAGTGMVTGVTTGTAIITYSLLSTGCSVTIPVTVSSALPSITGTADVCVGATAVLTDSVTGGVWSASGIAARIGSITGVVTGVSAGTAIISYLSGAGCMAVTNVTVNPLPPAITGIMQVCAGLSTSLYDASTGGLWSCGSSGIAGISATGVVTGVSAGTATVSYTAGCTTTAVVTVNPLPGAITGAANGCAGLTTLLMDSTAGGTWSSGNRAIATIDTFSGVMRGISGGVVMITYTLPTGCITTSSLSINPTPLPITGGATICNGLSTALSDPTPGGTWSSGALGIATVSGAGTVTGVSAGTAMISYAIGGCAAERVVLINPLPAPITGPDSVCEGGATMRVYDADSSRGLWTSTLVTIVDTTGVVTGYLAGMGMVTYRLGTGCSITRTITVTRLPAEIVGGVPYLCIGATVDFTDASASGAWSTSSAAVATVGSGTGRVTGIATGIAMITYTIPTGCFITQTISVNPQPAAIEGPPDLCVGASALFGDSTARGVWVSGATGIAAIGSASGIARGVSAGPATITYSITNSCGMSVVTKTITVNSLPDAGAITGPAALCQGDSGMIADIVPGGSWSIANSVANLTSGMVTGISPGTDTIVYTVANTWCANSTSYVVTIHPLPSAGIISDPQVVCQGATITLIDDAGSGAWSASNADASAAADGTVTGIAAGTDTIFYTVSNTWCTAFAESDITVNPLPDAGAITGPFTLCAGDSLTLQDPVTGGTWSANNATATVSGGTVKAIATAGIADITYAVTNSCGTATATHTIAINSLPDAGVITGTPNLCAGDSIILSDNVPNGVWVSGNPSVCAVSSGVVTAIATGTDTIMYQVTNSCGTATAQYPLTIYPSPAAPVITQGAIMVTVPDNYLSYQWSLGGKSIPGATTNSYAYSPWSVYNVTVTNTYGCAATAQPLTVTDCSPDAIVTYPNPASDAINILWCKNVTAIITTIDGRKLKMVENTNKVELGDLPNGAYMLVIFDTQGNKVKSLQFSKISR